MEVLTGQAQRRRCAAGRGLMLTALIVALIPIPSVEAQQAALLFDGVDDIATIPISYDWPRYTPSLTVEAWIRPSNVTIQELIAIVWGGINGSYALQADGSDPTKLVWTISLVQTDSAVSPTGALASGRWDHFAGTYDGTTMRLYQNGVLVAEQDHVTPGDAYVRGEIVLGLRPTAPHYAGSIDELRVWLAVRTPEQIKQWYNRPLTGAEPDLIGYWRLEEGTGQVMSDSSSSSISNDGVLGLTTAVEPEDPMWTNQAAPIAFFFDGFESGDTSAWDTAIP